MTVQPAEPSGPAPGAGGAGALMALLAQADVTDVLVNGADVWVDRGRGTQRAGVWLGPPAEVHRLAQRLAAAAASTRAVRSSTRDCPTAPGCTLSCHR
jgi:pilus assembly protein CpaF